jgi:hypothetical protein
MLEIDEKFRPRNVLIYPPSNNKTFEEHFHDEYIKEQYSHRIYIPIFWTNYYLSKNYGKGDLSELQEVINNLDRTKKYFTIVQYDDNILNDLGDLDLLIFTQGGYGKYKDRSYVIPLNCQFDHQSSSNEKDIFASFIGNIKGRHPLREKMENLLRSKKDYFISETINYDEFKNIMSRSLFSLCPRGYGQTSFRIFESLSIGSIPVYIYDEPLIPFESEFNFNDIGILIHESELDMIDDILKSKSKSEIDNYILNGISIYNNFFTYNGCYNKIIKILNNGI